MHERRKGQRLGSADDEYHDELLGQDTIDIGSYASQSIDDHQHSSIEQSTGKKRHSLYAST